MKDQDAAHPISGDNQADSNLVNEQVADDGKLDVNSKKVCPEGPFMLIRESNSIDNKGANQAQVDLLAN